MSLVIYVKFTNAAPLIILEVVSYHKPLVVVVPMNELTEASLVKMSVMLGSGDTLSIHENNGVEPN